MILNKVHYVHANDTIELYNFLAYAVSNSMFPQFVNSNALICLQKTNFNIFYKYFETHHKHNWLTQGACVAVFHSHCMCCCNTYTIKKSTFNATQTNRMVVHPKFYDFILSILTFTIVLFQRNFCIVCFFSFFFVLQIDQIHLFILKLSSINNFSCKHLFLWILFLQTIINVCFNL